MATEMLGKNKFGSPDERPYFYTIIWFADTTHLRIPPDFKHHLANHESDTATLTTPSGSWQVELEPKEGDICFGRGWQDFAKHHSLTPADFLVLKYNGSLSFDVVIYNKSGCEINYPSSRPSGNQESATCFTSSFPFFKHVVKNYNIGRSSTLVIPKAFQTKHLPLSKQRIILRDSEGISWPVTITVSTSQKCISMCGGWKAFSDNKSIKKGDICIFELVEQNKMQVHIFRHN